MWLTKKQVHSIIITMNHKEWTPNRWISVDVKNDDVMKAWRKMKKKLMMAGTLDEVKERRYFSKPSEIKREYNKRLKRQAAKNRRKQMEKDGF